MTFDEAMRVWGTDKSASILVKNERGQILARWGREIIQVASDCHGAGADYEVVPHSTGNVSGAQAP
jgi:hypothetical protein